MRYQNLPTGGLAAWAKFSGVALNNVDVTDLPANDSADRGAGVIALDVGLSEPDPLILMAVPRTLVLSLGLVDESAKSDKYLREVLDAVGEFGRTARGAILIFLLMQITHISPDISDSIGVSSPLTQYVQFLPTEVDLPTFWSQRHVELLNGTSLAAALDAKLHSLSREFDLLREGTIEIPWCRKAWWDEEEPVLSIDDWKIVDAWYRSRALDLPGTGHAMVPCIDMANHASGEATIALYETDLDGNAVLQLREGKSPKNGEEITITYGDEKGACEMLFSYGFIEDDMETARGLFLELEIPDDDPLKLAKIRVSNAAPGFKLFCSGDKMGWEGDFVWWGCVNEEDGLSFRVLQSNDGGRELQVAWKDENLDKKNLKDVLKQEELWDVFQLRAIVLLQARIDEQMTRLNESQGVTKAARSDYAPRSITSRWNHIVKLRELEWKLLTKGYQDFQEQKEHLLNSKTVQDYLESVLANGVDPAIQDDDDFA